MNIENLQTQVFKPTAEELNTMYKTNRGNSGFVFADRTRLCEQEALHVAISKANPLIETNFAISIETPTNETYSFTGPGGRKASTDLAIMRKTNKVWSPEIRIEFKAGNPSRNKNHKQPIEKDIEKLFRENVDGSMFHLIESSKSGTLSNIFSKYHEGISKLTKSNVKDNSKKVVFTFVIIKPKCKYICLLASKSDWMSNYSIWFNKSTANAINLLTVCGKISDWDVETL